VIERSQQLGLALEARKPIRILRKRLGQDFDRHVAAQLGVAGTVDHAHSAFAEFLGNPVVGNGLANHDPPNQLDIS
jgi:hypothetical protein